MAVFIFWFGLMDRLGSTQANPSPPSQLVTETRAAFRPVSADAYGGKYRGWTEGPNGLTMSDYIQVAFEDNNISRANLKVEEAKITRKFKDDFKVIPHSSRVPRHSASGRHKRWPIDFALTFYS